MQPKKKAGPYTPLRSVHAKVMRKEIFRGNSVFSRWIWDEDPAHPIPNQTLCPTGAKPMRYVVYSYGSHFPMYVWDEATGEWYGNSDRYSVTTSKHQTYCHPPSVHHWFPTERIKQIASVGAVESVIQLAQSDVSQN